MGTDVDMQAKDNGAAARKNASGAEALLGVARGKAQAATADPGADRSRANAERVKREGWNKTGGPTHMPDGSSTV
jgi:hypothetical protein